MKLYEFIQDRVQNRRKNHSSIFHPSTLFQPCHLFSPSREVLKLPLLTPPNALLPVPLTCRHGTIFLFGWDACTHGWPHLSPSPAALKFRATVLACRFCRKCSSERTPFWEAWPRSADLSGSGSPPKQCR